MSSSHPAGPVPQARSEVAEATRMLVRTVLPVGLVLGLALAVFGGSGHDLTIVLQDRFPEDSEFSGFFTVVFSSALLVCSGVALGAIVVARAWARSTGHPGKSSPALTAGLAVGTLGVVLAFDDMMMVHDAMLPGNGIPETLALGLFGLVGAALVVWAYRPMHGEGLGLAFLVALAMLGASLGGDILESLLSDVRPGLASAVGHGEDVVKFLAYTALCHLLVLIGRRILSRTLQSATERAAREAVERAGTAGRGDRVPMRVRTAARDDAAHTTPFPRP